MHIQPTQSLNRAATFDKHHRYWDADFPGPKVAHLAAGDTLKADSGFACLDIGEEVTVRQAPPSDRARGTNAHLKPLFVTCKCGRHYLTPNADGHVDGFTIVTPAMFGTTA